MAAGGGAWPPGRVNGDACGPSSVRARDPPRVVWGGRGGGGGAMPLEDDYVRQHVEGFCGSELFDVIQMHLRRRGVI